MTSLVTNNKPKGLAATGKDAGKKQIFDGVVIKTKPVTTRQPLRPVAGTRPTTSIATKEEPVDGGKQEHEVNNVKDENAMMIDPVPLPAVRRSLAKESNGHATRHTGGHRRMSSRTNVVAQRHAEEDAEASRVFKKRRTSSEAPENPAAIEEARLKAEEEEIAARIAAELENYAEELEADPEGPQWEDLDSDDIDDPLMVSEYVVDIFKYLKQVEVNPPSPH